MMAGIYTTRRRLLAWTAAIPAIVAPLAPARANKAADWDRVLTRAQAAFSLRRQPVAADEAARKRQREAISLAFSRAVTALQVYITRHIDTQGPATGPRVYSYFVLGIYLEYSFNYWDANTRYRLAARDISYLKEQGRVVPQYATSRSSVSIDSLLPRRLQETEARMKITPDSEAPAVRRRRLGVSILKSGTERTVLDDLESLEIEPAPDFYAVTMPAPLDEPSLAPPN